MAGWTSATPLEGEGAKGASHFRATGKNSDFPSLQGDYTTRASIPNHHVLLSPPKPNELKEKGHEDDLFGSQILRGQQN